MRPRAMSTGKAKKPVPAARQRKADLASVRGWLDDSDPFFATMGMIIGTRHSRRPRRTASRRRSR